MSEARFGIVRCPGCGGSLHALEREGLSHAPLAAAAPATATGERVPPLSMCTTCFGVWFDWWAGETSAICTALLSLPHSLRAPVRVDGACPRDGMRLVSQPYLDGGPSVRRCPRCMGLFAARAQLDELAEFSHRLPESSGTIEDRSVLARLWRLFA